jgi:tetratricopeptide (TPR) repeat protein
MKTKTMKLKNLFIGTMIASSFASFAQDDKDKECLRMRFLAQEEMKLKNYAGATAYYLKGETICGNYDKTKYDNMTKIITNTIATETDKDRKMAYMDTLTQVYGRMEKLNFLDQATYLTWAKYMYQLGKPDRLKIDGIYQKHLEAGGTFNDEQLSLYFNNLVVQFNEAKDAGVKQGFKKRIISDYFTLSKMIEANSLSVKSQEALTASFNNIVRSCDDILPDLSGFMANLPQDKEMKKKTVMNFMNLLKEKGCTGSKEYEMLVDTIIKIDNSVDAVLAKAQLLRAKKRYDEAIGSYNQAKGMATDPAQKEEIEFNILEIQYHEKNAYQTAYKTAMGISGANRAKALMIAANCVAKLANSCGSSTFERKCNYLYAAELAQRAGDGGAAARFRANGPTESEIFDNNNPSSVSLSCWGVSVSPK